MFGVGAGWIEPEMSDHGVAYRTRFQLLKEQIRAIKEIWTKDEAEFHGRFVNFDKMKAYPKPYQRPHPPIIMGGEGGKALECAAELCDGWAPWRMEWTKVKEGIVELKKQALANGRDPNSLEVSLFEESLPDKATLQEMETFGVKRIILTLQGQSREQALPKLDHLANVAR
jgi:alkanesulfonate monooxygenase SsuD/methylene tetrahydromethanopterin reductase-like flavin-dependent oxidoreductase (luciferase family)